MHPSDWRPFAGVLLLTLFGMTDVSLAAEVCSDSKVLVAGGVTERHSILVGPFNLLPWSYPDNRQFGETEGRKLRENFTVTLTKELQALGFSRGAEAASDLVIEGSTKDISDTPGGIRVNVSALMKRASDGTDVLQVSECATSIKVNEGRLGIGFLRNYPSMLDSFFDNIARALANTIAAAAKP